jgi:hypothetical protein
MLLKEELEPGVILARDIFRLVALPLIRCSIVHFVPVMSDGFK